MKLNLKIGGIEGNLESGQRFLLAMFDDRIVYYAHRVINKSPSYLKIADFFGFDFEKRVFGGGICDYRIIGKSLGFWTEFEALGKSGLVEDILDEMKPKLLRAYKKIDSKIKEIKIFKNEP